MMLIGAVISLIIGLWVIKAMVNGAGRMMTKRNIDPSLIPFLKSILNIGLKAALFISVASMVGIEMTSFAAILGAAGLAVGLAMQGTLQNFAGGVMIMLFKPFKVGDVLEAQGYTGSVKEIEIFNTIMATPDNKIIIIPNGGLANSSMINYSNMDTQRVDFSFGIGYDDDFEKAKSIINGLIEKDERIHKDPAPFVRLGELADSAVNLAVRPYADSSDYWEVYFDIYEAGKEALDAANITIPFPQVDVPMDQ
jgi:small conductance mechanosensitive channel